MELEAQTQVKLSLMCRFIKTWTTAWTLSGKVPVFLENFVL
jgi:hypothetical protein